MTLWGKERSEYCKTWIFTRVNTVYYYLLFSTFIIIYSILLRLLFIKIIILIYLEWSIHTKNQVRRIFL